MAKKYDEGLTLIDSNDNTLTHAKQLLAEGKFQETIQLIEHLEKKEDLSAIDRLGCQLLRSVILNKRGRFKESFDLAEKVYREIQGQNQPLQEMNALNTMSVALMRLGKYNESLNLIKKGEKLLPPVTKDEQSDILLKRSNFVHQKATIYWLKGDFDQALEYFEQTLAWKKRLGLKPAIATAFNNIGAVYYRKGDFNRALNNFKRSLELLEIIGNQQDIARALNNIGQVYHDKGELDHALEYLKHSLTLKEKIGNKQEIAGTLSNIGDIYWYKGELDHALKYLKRCLVLKEEIGKKDDIAAGLHNIGRLYQSRGELNHALDYFERSLAHRQVVGNKLLISESLTAIGNIFWRKGNLKQALEYHKQSLEIQEKINNKKELAITFENVGLVYWSKGDLEQATDYLKRSLTLREKIGDNWHTSRALFYLVSVALDKLSLKKAQIYLKYLQTINNQEENKIINQRSRLAEALVLKANDQTQDHFKAKKMLTQLVEEEIIDHELTMLAQFALCEILLGILEKSYVQELLEAVQSHLNKLLKIAHHQTSVWLLTGTYVLQCRILFIELKHSWSFDKIQELNRTLQQVRQLALENQLFIILIQAYLLIATLYFEK
ncbi:MAG: tetratricopeptide repeat protein, partial [Candidatus Hermodarchaeota archaeon]